jgi:ADP-ribosylglycohydrolase
MYEHRGAQCWKDTSTMANQTDLLAHPDDRLARARCALEGLSVGDALGQHWLVYMLRGGALAGSIPRVDVPPPPWYFTDDTTMALSVVSVLRQAGRIQQEQLAADFALRFQQDPFRGYGAGMQALLRQIAAGDSWREASKSLFGGQGSFGNGAAMRVAPLGAYFADSLETVVEQAQRSAEVTHAHPEGIAGAIAVAVAAAWAWRLGQRGKRPDRTEFLDLILPEVPESAVRAALRTARNLGSKVSAVAAAARLGNGSQISAQDTVPFVLWCAGQYLERYETALRQTLRGGGDLDTTCAMVGGIVVLYSGSQSIPPAWLQAREPLPVWPFQAASALD